MYVCICNGYRDCEIRQMAQQGFTCAVETYTALGNGPSCGSCVDTAQQIIDEARCGADAATSLAAAE